MNRDKEDELPAMQVKFIDTICLPIYEVHIALHILSYLVLLVNRKYKIFIFFSVCFTGVCSSISRPPTDARQGEVQSCALDRTIRQR